MDFWGMFRNSPLDTNIAFADVVIIDEENGYIYYGYQYGSKGRNQKGWNIMRVDTSSNTEIERKWASGINDFSHIMDNYANYNYIFKIF